MNFFFNKIICALLLSSFLLVACVKDLDSLIDRRSFESSFENVDDFEGFYITPQGYLNTSYQELNDSIVHSGNYAHKAWVTGPNLPSVTTNNNHRAYPTVQLYKTEKGAFTGPCRVTLWVWLDMELKPDLLGVENDWISFATFTHDDSDDWNRTVLVNLSSEGVVHLMHVPNQSEQKYEFQTSSIKFPQREWVKLTVFLDFRNDAYAKVWQNDELVSHAKVLGVENKLSQAHFGLYCSPQIESGVLYNDDLSIEMVDIE